MVSAQIVSFPYEEDFETGDGGWTVSEATTDSWGLGVPTGLVVNTAASGSNAWVTNLSGNYLNNENGWVQSPVFDLASLVNPMIELSIWWNSEFSWDGAVLQSSINSGGSWQNVGAVGDNNNWYNDNAIDGNPGGQTTGWTGRNSTGNGSGNWVVARHSLSGLVGQDNVIFRIAFGSDGSVQDDGFAFDLIKIHETPCYQPTDLIANQTSDSDVIVDWLSDDSHVDWTYEYGASGFVLGTGTSATVNTAGVSLPGLAFGAYDIYVKASCFGIADSDWSLLTFNMAELPCYEPTDLKAVHASGTNTAIKWVKSGGETSWTYEYGISGFTIGTGITGTTNTSMVRITGLIDGEGYDVYVRANCDGKADSGWIMISFGYLFVPDDNFENYLETHDINGNVVALGSASSLGDGIANNDYVNREKISAVTILDIPNLEITDLTGIEAFTSLVDLYCYNNNLKNLNVRNGTALANLWCYGNDLSVLDVSNNTALMYLYCHENELSNLNIGNNTSLKTLWCYDNQLSSLDVSASTALTELYCYENQLTNLELGSIASLSKLYCYENKLGSLNVTSNTALIDLRCGDNALTTLDVTQNIALNTLWCRTNQLAQLNLTNNINLSSLSAGYNQLTSLDVSANTGLVYLQCFNNQISSLDVDTNTSLLRLQCQFNQIASLDVSNNLVLERLLCSSNTLTSIDVSNNLSLWWFDCGLNELSALDISNNLALFWLDCAFNTLGNLDVSNNLALENLLCSGNSLTALDVSNNLSLDYLRCGSNLLTELDLSNNVALEDLSASDSPLLERINVRNGNNMLMSNAYDFFVYQSPNLTCIDVDDVAWSTTNWTSVDEQTVFSVSCDGSETYIPDDNFEQALINLGLDTVLDDVVLTANINTVLSLDISGLNISDLTGIEGFLGLTTLNCATNNLSDLDLTANTNLTSLDCSNNQLKALDLKDHLALSSFDGSNNLLESLLINNGSNTAFSSFVATGNTNLLCVQVDDAVWSTSNWTSIDVQSSFNENCYGTNYTFVPDDNFEQALIDLGYDSLLDNYVLTSNIESVTSLVVSGKGVSDFTGIEDFVALTYLDCSANSLSVLGVNSNIVLESLFCSSNDLTSLDLSANTSLVELSFSGNQISTIDLSSNTVLESLYCGSNTLTALDVSFNLALIDLNCYNNNLSNLDVTASASLTSLNCAYNQLSTLEVSQNTLLTSISCGSNQLSDLDVSQSTALVSLSCWDNQLSSLDISQNTLLTVLSCWDNQLSNLDVSQNTLLTVLYCSSNQLSSLDVTQNTLLTGLSCGDNQLSSLDVTQNTLLTYIGCSSNQLSILDVSQNTLITDLVCSSNQFVSLDFSNQSSLSDLYCNDNPFLENLNLQNGNNYNKWSYNVSNNPMLFCIQVDGLDVLGISRDAQAVLSTDCSSSLTYVPDNNFEQALIGLGLDDVLDDYVKTSNINSVQSLDVSGRGINDLIGIEDFESLLLLKCHSNNLNSLNTSFNTMLTGLYCTNNQLTDLDVSANLDLKTLNCSNNEIGNLDVSLNTQLTHLDCSQNQLTAINLGSISALEDLYVVDNQIANLDISQNTALRYVWCANNLLTALNVDSNSNLVWVYCDYNQITSLDFSQNPALLDFSGGSNLLTELSINNGSNLALSDFNSLGNISLSCIQVDNETWSNTNWGNVDGHSSFSEDCSALGIYDVDKLTLNIYPNPTRDILYIKGDVSALKSIDVYSVLGVRVMQIKDRFNEIKLSNLQPALYLIKLNSDVGSVTRRIVKE